jgi:hypothetical protein
MSLPSASILAEIRGYLVVFQSRPPFTTLPPLFSHFCSLLLPLLLPSPSNDSKHERCLRAELVPLLPIHHYLTGSQVGATVLVFLLLRPRREHGIGV